MWAEVIKPRWFFTSLFVLAAGFVMIRLGFWQLDRLQQRRNFNSQVLSQINLPPLNLNEDLPVALLPGMEYRHVIVTGTYDYEDQILLRNQVWDDQPGYALITPLVIKDANYTILVNRGWISLENGQDLSPFTATDEVTLEGLLRLPLEHATIGGVPDPTLQPGEARLLAWNYLDMDRIQSQTTFTLLPVYLQEQPGRTTPPIPSLPNLEINEGPHLAYAIQWFGFTALLWGAYPFYVKKQLMMNNYLEVES